MISGYSPFAGLLEDEKVQRSCVVRWLLPTEQAFVRQPASSGDSSDGCSASSDAAAPPRIELKFSLDTFRPGEHLFVLLPF